MSDIDTKPGNGAAEVDREGKYPNLLGPNEPLGELKRIERLEGMAKRAPNIRWGPIFKSWSPQRQLHYAMRLASAQNYAAAMMQDARNEILEIATKQEAQIKQLKAAAATETAVWQQQIAKSGAEAQKLYGQIVSQQAEVKKLKRRVLELEAEREQQAPGTDED